MQTPESDRAAGRTAPAFLRLMAGMTLALVLLGAACRVRAALQIPFNAPNTYAHVGKNLLADDPRPLATAIWLAPQVVGQAARAWLPAEILFLLALAVLWRALAGGRPRNAAGPRPAWTVPILAAGLALAGAWAVEHFCFLDHLYAGDEFAYFFQARLFALGHLTLPSPPDRDFYACNNLVNNGQWYAMYPPGWPLVLSLFDRAGWPELASPLAGALSVAVLWALARDLFGPRAAALTALFLVASPAFMLNAASWFAHTAQLLFTATALWLGLRARRSGSPLTALGCGLALGMAILIRPLEGVLLIGIMVAWHLLLARTGDRATRGATLLLVPMAAGLVTFFLLICNLRQTGSPWHGGYDVTYGTGMLNFAAFGHSAPAAMLNALYATGRAIVWGCPLLVEAAAAALLLRRGTATTALLGYGALTVAAFTLYFNLGQVEYGSRYYLCAWALAAAAAGAGADALLERWSASPRQAAGAAFFVAVFAAAGCWPGFLQEARRAHAIGASVDAMLAQSAGPRALIFVRQTPENYAAGYTRNLPDFSAGPRRVLFLDPAANRRLRARFADRPAFVLNFDPSDNRFRLYPFGWQLLPGSDAVAAGITFDTCLGRPEQALREWESVPRHSPSDISARLDRLRLCFRLGRYQETVRLADDLQARLDGLAALHYDRGRALLALGFRRLAAEELKRAYRLDPEDPVAQRRIAHWLERITPRE